MGEDKPDGGELDENPGDEHESDPRWEVCAAQACLLIEGGQNARSIVNGCTLGGAPIPRLVSTRNLLPDCLLESKPACDEALACQLGMAAGVKLEPCSERICLANLSDSGPQEPQKTAMTRSCSPPQRLVSFDLLARHSELLSQVLAPTVRASSDGSRGL